MRKREVRRVVSFVKNSFFRLSNKLERERETDKNTESFSSIDVKILMYIEIKYRRIYTELFIDQSQSLHLYFPIFCVFCVLQARCNRNFSIVESSVRIYHLLHGIRAGRSSQPKRIHSVATWLIEQEESEAIQITVSR